jgi:hypothetical protein
MMASNQFKIFTSVTALLLALISSAQHRVLRLGSTHLEGAQVDSMVLDAVTQALGKSCKGLIKGDFSFPINEKKLRLIDLKINNLDSGEYSGTLWIDSIQFEIESGFVFRSILLRPPKDSTIINLFSKDTMLVDSLLWAFIRNPESDDHIWIHEAYCKILEGNGRIVDYIIESNGYQPSFLLHKFYYMGIQGPEEAIAISSSDLKKVGIKLSERADRMIIYNNPEKTIDISYRFQGTRCCRSYSFDENQRLFQVYNDGKRRNEGKRRKEKFIQLKYRRGISELSLKDIVRYFPP